ncbi:MAG TPA: rRNA methyltransferase, partial [Syntrophobacteraceae bacterium]|nr:rRNA methyltransferase [Syntrophobacteraceae bacterium]
MAVLARVLQIWLNWILARPRTVLAVAFLTAVISMVFAVKKLDMQTDQLELISPQHPLIALSDRLDPFHLGGKTTFTVAVKAPTPEQGIWFANALSSLIEQDSKHFRSVLYRIDPNLLKSWALLYPDAEDLRYIHAAVKEHTRLLQGLAEEPDLITLLRLINQEMTKRMVGELFTGFLDESVPNAETPRTEGPLDLDFLIQTLNGLRDGLEGAQHYRSPWFSFFKNNFFDLSTEGFFWEGGKRYLLMFVAPEKGGDGFDAAQGSIRELRSLIQQVRRTYPDVEAGVTGQEALNNDEMATAMHDMNRATWLSLGGILVLLVVFLRGLKRPFIELVALGIGLCWTLGWTTLVIGHLNILSIVFAPLLCGLGVDYGIHWFTRFEEREGRAPNDRLGTIQWVNRHSGPGIFLAGLSAALSFLPLVLTGFRGLMELGLIAGFGIVFILLSDFTVLPALSIFMAGNTVRQSVSRNVGEDRNLFRFSPREGYLVLILAALLCLLSIWGTRRVSFDLNPLRLQTASAESVVWEKQLIQDSRRSPIAAAAFASSPEEVRRKAKELMALPTVAEVESVFSLLPEHQEEKLPLLHALKPYIPTIRTTPLNVKASDPDDLREVLARIRFKMQQELAVQEGADPKLVTQMEQVRRISGDISRTLQSDPNAEQRLNVYRQRFHEDLLNTWDFLQSGAAAQPMSIEDLPDTLRKWLYHDGQYLLRIYPKESVWEEGALTRFITDLYKVDPDVVGDPVSLHVFASAYKKACSKASIYALIAIFVLLLVTFRSLYLSSLAFVPLVAGTLWTVGIMGFAGVDFNLANSIFMPL